MAPTASDAAPDRLFERAAEAYLGASRRLALTGAGISVESGIPDFRSPRGLWTIFDPEEYASLEVFVRNPTKAWRLYRAIGRILSDARPNRAHQALGRLESAGLLDGIITQNIDRLHQAAGSVEVAEIHGHHDRLHCLWCGETRPLQPSLYEEDAALPRCPTCAKPLKPSIVLFGEAVRELDRIETMVRDCQVLLVVGTSAEVYPAAGIPDAVMCRGGIIIEFNLEPTRLTRYRHPPSGTAGDREPVSRGQPADEAPFFFAGPATRTLSTFVDRVLERSR